MESEEIYIEDDIILDVFRDHIPAVFMEAEKCRENPICVVRSKRKRTIANCIPLNIICNKVRISPKDKLLINRLLYDDLGRPESIVLEPVIPERSVLVYGTLLSRYWNPHNGSLEKSWHPLNKELMVRGIASGYMAIWPENWFYPYAINNPSSMVLGEVYINVEEQEIAYLDNVESEYIRTRVTVKPADNLVNDKSFDAQLYVYKRSISGPSYLTFRYGDSFYIKSEEKFICYHYSKDLYVKWLEGNIPIILSCPHGGYSRPENIPIYNARNGDPKTLEITEELVLECHETSGHNVIPSVVASRIHPSRIDMNRPVMYAEPEAMRIYRKYHTKMEEIISNLKNKYEKVMILDIHGMKDTEEDIILGTDYGRSIRDTKILSMQLRDTLEDGFLVGVNKFGYSGYYITQKYGKIKNVGVVQLEVARRIRMDSHQRRRLIEIVTRYIMENFYKS